MESLCVAQQVIIVREPRQVLRYRSGQYVSCFRISKEENGAQFTQETNVLNGRLSFPCITYHFYDEDSCYRKTMHDSQFTSRNHKLFPVPPTFRKGKHEHGPASFLSGYHCQRCTRGQRPIDDVHRA